MKHINIPIFIPHLGCPNQCIFCNQRHISGTESFNEESVKHEILKVLSTINEEKCEIAFFGGSFTGIDRCLMIRLLDIAQEFVDAGKVSGIRMSTRPDYISIEIIEILCKYSVSCVELGIQTINDDVLRYLKRGHTFDDTKKAIALLNEFKIPFVGQMMVGLPKASIKDELECALFIAENNACGSRIYPTLVLANTDLAMQYYDGEYIPLTLDDAIERSANVLKIFLSHNIPCIRIGLCDSENLHSENTFVAGPNSPSIGEMVKSKVYYDLIADEIQTHNFKNKQIIIECPIGKTSQIVGQRKKNINKLKNEFNIKSIKILEKEYLEDFKVKVREKEEDNAFKIT